MKFFLFLLLLIIAKSGFSQQKFFRDTPSKIEMYRELASEFWNKRDSAKSRSYDTDSIRNCIVNSMIDNYEFQSVNGKVFKTREIKKPIFLLASASWCAPCKAMVGPLSKIAEEYSDKIQFVVLYWDTKEQLKELPSDYSNKIIIVASPTKSSSDGMMPLSIANFNHSLGYPTQYLIKNKKIIDFHTGAAVTEAFMLNSEGKWENRSFHTSDEVFQINYNIIEENVKKLLDS